MIRTYQIVRLPLRAVRKCMGCKEWRQCEIFGRYRMEPFYVCDPCGAKL